MNEDNLFVRVNLDNKKAEDIGLESYSYWKSVFHTFIKKPSAIISLSLLIIMIIGIILIPLFAGPGDLSSNVNIKNELPSIDRFFGTDLIGRDLWYVCWKATGNSLIYALRATIINVFIGVIIGFIWGYNKKLDRFFIEIYNFISNIPSLLLFMLLSFVFVQSLPNLPSDIRLTICLCLTGWLPMSRLVRNQVIIIREREYNLASIALNTSAYRIITRNLLPHILAIIVTELALLIPTMISSEVSLSYFGLGLPDNAISLGAVLTLGIEKFGVYNYQLLFPALMLGIIIFIFFLLGTSLSDALNPKNHR
ncbi:MAG: ABC transporter permease [Acholeplasmatales bacterium]|nr:ABC transporter permease [Acholeplasmatales bacterium]